MRLIGKNHFEICRIGHKEDLAFQKIVDQCGDIARQAAVNAAEKVRCKLLATILIRFFNLTSQY